MVQVFHDRVRYEVNDRIATITLARSERMNAFDAAMYDGVNDALDAFAADEEAWVAVLQADGDRAFTVGADVNALNANAEKGITTGLGGLKLDSDMVTDKPIVAAISGYCVGEGVNLVLGCDLVFADASAKFMISEVRIGVNPVDIPLKLARRLGYNRAFRFLSPGDAMPIDWLVDAGLVDEVVTDVRAHARAFAQRLVAECAPLALRAQKATLWHASFNDEAYARDLGNNRRTTIRLSEDYAEGRQAFGEKRTPHYKGR